MYESESLTVCHSVEEAFGFAEVRVVSFADLYRGKIVAALDRQHPRDLFDLRSFLRMRVLTKNYVVPFSFTSLVITDNVRSAGPEAKTHRS